MPYSYTGNYNMPYWNTAYNQNITWGNYTVPSTSNTNSSSGSDNSETYDEYIARITKEEQEKYQKEKSLR